MGSLVYPALLVASTVGLGLLGQLNPVTLGQQVGTMSVAGVLGVVAVASVCGLVRVAREKNAVVSEHITDLRTVILEDKLDRAETREVLKNVGEIMVETKNAMIEMKTACRYSK